MKTVGIKFSVYLNYIIRESRIANYNIFSTFVLYTN